MDELTREGALAAIKRVRRAPEPQPTFNEGRWPYTYAYDYMRQHGIPDGNAGLRSRADCAALFRGNPDKEWIVRRFAFEHCLENNIPLSDAARVEINNLREWRLERGTCFADAVGTGTATPVTNDESEQS